jgi:hypothetical protein
MTIRACLVTCLAAALGLGLGMAVGSGSAARAPDPTTVDVYVNGHPVQMASPARLEDGEVVAPVTPVVEAMGGAVGEWNLANRSLYIKTESPWELVDWDFGRGQPVGPYSFDAVGAVLAVRHHLSERQWASVQEARDASAPILARFEIVNVANMDMGRAAFGRLLDAPDLSRLAGQWQGFSVRTRLYWVWLEGPKDAPPTGYRVERFGRDPNTGQPGQGARGQGPRATKLRVETVQYLVRPDGVRTRARTPNRSGLLSEAILGTSGWRIDETQTTHPEPAQSSVLGPDQQSVPLCDVSAQKVSLTSMLSLKTPVAAR